MCLQPTVVGPAQDRHSHSKGGNEKEEEVTGPKHIQNPTGQTPLVLKLRGNLWLDGRSALRASQVEFSPPDTPRREHSYPLISSFTSVVYGTRGKPRFENIKRKFSEISDS